MGTIAPSFSDIATSSTPALLWLYNQISPILQLVVGLIIGFIVIVLLLRLVSHYD